MARIRSIHPGQATDEDFVAMSPWARLAVIHLRCEADDNGIFEWKPLALKMRMFPADDVDMAALLAEMEANNQIRQFVINGKPYGAIRNFRRWQRMRRPAPTHPITDDVRHYVGLDDDVTDNVRTEPDKVGKEPADVGCRVKDVTEPNGSGRCAPVADLPADKALFAEGLQYLSRTLGRPPAALRPLLGRWLKLTGNDHAAVLALLREAERTSAADPPSWIEARLRPPKPRRNAVMTAFDNLERELAHDR